MAENTFPHENFATVQTTLTNGKPAVGSINRGYKNYSQRSKYPWFLKISIGLELDNCLANGLPNESEQNVARKFEDDLMREINKIATSHYIGHLFNDTFLDVYVYLNEPEKTHQYLQTQINKAGLIRGFGYKVNNDPTWDSVKVFLQ